MPEQGALVVWQLVLLNFENVDTTCHTCIGVAPGYEVVVVLAGCLQVKGEELALGLKLVTQSAVLLELGLVLLQGPRFVAEVGHEAEDNVGKEVMERANGEVAGE